MSISVGLSTAMRALMAQQTALDTTSQNVANVNTPGYSRQRVDLAAVPPANPLSPGAPGEGVQVQDIQRIHDTFVDFQRRGEESSSNYYSTRSSSLQLEQTAFNEPSANGMSEVLTSFFNAWSDLANDPGQPALRSSVVDAGSTLALTAQNLSSSLSSMRSDANQRVASDVSQINTLAQQIAGLNSKIVTLHALGNSASDLRDQRGQALDSLAKLTNISYTESDTGSISVSIGGRSLVSGNTVSTLQTAPNVANNNYYDVTWTAGGAKASVTGGELGALLYQRDTDIPGRLTDLNTLVSQVITDVNTVHAAGYALDGVTTGTNFFTGTDATNIAVNPALQSNINLVATAQTAASPGDGSNALALANLQYAKNLNAGTQSYGDFYTAMVTQLGVDTQNTQALATSQQQTLDHLNQLQDSVSGVNLDEEMVNLTQYQRGYEAAARVVNIVNQMLNTLINSTV